MTKKRSKLTTNPYFHTEEEHKDWYEPNVMGKQRGKPRYDLKEVKKPKSKKTI